MRGVYTAGSLLALHLLGYGDAFDDLFGTSAGAVNGAHFLSGLGHTKVATYYRWLSGRRFINPWRLRKIVDIDYFVDDVLNRLERVEVEQVLRARTELWVAVLNERTAEVEVLNPRRDGLPLLLVLKAAVAIPVVYGRPIVVGDGSYLDAGFMLPFPLSAAVEAGCTDVLVVTAQTAGFRTPPRNWWQMEIFNRRCARGNDRLRAVYRSSAEAQNRQRRLADGTDTCDGVNIATLAPVDVRVKPTTTDPNLLRIETIRMCRQVLNMFGASNQGLEQLMEAGVV
jgi:predicted patatin/cPLA2 family phospholipase